MIYSPEQLEIINSPFLGIVVQAGAGAGKTTVIERYCTVRSHLRFLYLAFNSPIAKEAEAEFPPNVDCLTFHALSMRRFGSTLKHKLDNNLSVGHLIKLGQGGFDTAMKALDLLNRFLISDSETIMCFSNGNHSVEVVGLAELAWINMTDAKSSFPITQDGQFKFFTLNFSIAEYDGVIVDEAQDSNDAKIDLVLRYEKERKDGIKLIVGDRHQQLNKWNGATDAMSRPEFKSYSKYSLQESYRFGSEVGYIANAVLKNKKGIDIHISGLGDQTRILFSQSYEQSVFSCVDGPIACLSRTVNGCIDLGLEHHSMGRKIHWVGGLASYRLADLHDLALLKANAKVGFKDPLFKKKWKDFNNYCFTAKVESDNGRLKSIKSLDRYPDAIEILVQLEESSVAEEEADVLICTANRSKGKGWKSVFINNDFPNIGEGGVSGERLDDEINVIYVALTRVKRTMLIAKGHLTEYLLNYKESMKKTSKSLDYI